MYYGDNSFIRELGEKYEQFVAAYYTQTLGCRVIYHGHILGVADGGIDLIALSPDTTYLIQCKNWSQFTIHEDVVNQLAGAAIKFARQYPAAKCIQPVVASSYDRVAADAYDTAKYHNILIQIIPFKEHSINGQMILSDGRIMTPFIPPHKRREHMRPTQDVAAYQQHVRDLIDEVQYPKFIPEPELIPPITANPTSVIIQAKEPTAISKPEQTLTPKPTTVITQTENPPSNTPTQEITTSTTKQYVKGALYIIVFGVIPAIIGVFLYVRENIPPTSDVIKWIKYIFSCLGSAGTSIAWSLLSVLLFFMPVSNAVMGTIYKIRNRHELLKKSYRDYTIKDLLRLFLEEIVFCILLGVSLLFIAFANHLSIQQLPESVAFILLIIPTLALFVAYFILCDIAHEYLRRS